MGLAKWPVWIAALLGAVLVLSGCGSSSSSRYRMTVEIEAPDGVKTGNAVREVTVIRPPNIPMLGENIPQRRLEGEAVAVDLGQGRVLFALLLGENGSNAQPNLGISTLIHEQASAFPVPIEIWPAKPSTYSPKFENLMPMLVTFGDLDDPTSVVEVDPDDLTASFGEGYALKRITVQVTDEAVTTGIEKRLGWLGETRGAISKIPMSERPPLGTELPLHATLSGTSFRIGTSQ